MPTRKRPGQLSERHRKVLAVLEAYLLKNGYAPTIREIGEQASVPSTSQVTYYLKRLEKEGYVKRARGVSRGVRLLKTASGKAFDPNARRPNANVPLLGRIVAGAPIPIPDSDFAFYDPDSAVELPASLLPPDSAGLFALEVEGDSMVDAMVNEGDLVVLEQVTQAENGDMVAAWLPGRGETTLKYFFRENGKVRLQPANPAYAPLLLDEQTGLEVQGRVVLVMRRL